MKGIFYSVLTIIILIPIIALSSVYSETLREYGTDIGSDVRLKSGLYFMDSVNEDFNRAAKIIGRRSIVACINHIIESGEGLNSAEDSIVELFENKTLNGNSSDIMDYSIYEWVNRSDSIAQKRGFILERQIKNVAVSMEDPWNVMFHIDIYLKIEDQRGTFSYEKNVTKNIPVSIEGLEDPLYVLRTNNKISRKISKCEGNLTERVITGSGGNGWGSGVSIQTGSPSSVEGKDEKILLIGTADQDFGEFAGVVTGSNTTPLSTSYVIGGWDSVPNNTRVVVEGDDGEVWNIENLYNMRENKLYMRGEGPSFLDRMENKLLNSYPGAGLESLVDKEEMLDKMGYYRDRSNVDYIYFNTTVLNIYKIKGMPDKFRIDEEHLSAYGVDNTLSYA